MSRAKRKLEHIEHALSTGQTGNAGFDDIRFVHRSLPDVNVSDISLSTFIGELEISSPIFINAMTGGGGKATEGINQQLAEIAAEVKIPIASGSQMSAIKNESEKPSYEIIRKTNPNGVVFANVGSEATAEQAEACVDMLEADALQVHLNVIQELVMPEGDREFKGALNRIEKIVSKVPVPVIVKEVGYGMGKETAAKLNSIGVPIIDVGGFGGTNFSKIENSRREQSYSFFNEWGIPTAVSIAEVNAQVSHENRGVTILGSGGIKTASHIAKSIALGANAAGMAGTVLKWLQLEGLERTIDRLYDVLEELRMIMTAVGASNIGALQKAPIILLGETKDWLDTRNISTNYYSNRNL
ncbi:MULTISPECIES: type 2 isopentenyl-diphosphate Delta-isomerase [Bacillaceae]|uniref:Isopentenyl-diphosphate delta-isomerase n=1 Tax=Evansella alkalicola TaxID=745819 RepID=A0ABS6JZF7_9BACI|nr:MULTISPECIES: type 2 isopentenyl-diphosphate Delta-isomerase [Bacillaceae]MBU9723968.1 type 2 isopentenyl-diphosphate Delta-isomerase [Bacillus alkalicola]